MNNEFDEQYDADTLDDDCPCCRMMRDEWGVIEEAPLQRLLDRGLSIPQTETLGDDALKAKLQEIFAALADLRIFLEHTDHLSDRELYDLLCSDVLVSPLMFSPGDTCSAAHVSLTDHGSADGDNWLRYYANEEDRQQWLRQWPDYDMPPHVDPAYDRDAMLPLPYDSVSPS